MSAKMRPIRETIPMEKALRLVADTACPIERTSRVALAHAAGRVLATDIIATRTDYDADFRQAYLGGHIRYNLGVREKAGLNKFIELLKTHGNEPIFVPVIVE